MCSIFLIKPQR